MLIFYIRHGEPIYDPDSLTPLGERQAEAVAKRLAMYGIDRIYSSTSTRAYLTAVPTAELTHLEIQKIDFLNEKYAFDYFSQNSHWMFLRSSIKKLFVSNEILQLGHQWYEHPAFEASRVKEGLEFFRPRIDDLLLSLGYEHDRQAHTYRAVRPNEDRVAIFAHGGMGSVLLSEILDIPYPQFAAHYTLSHSAVTVIDFPDKGEEIVPLLLQFGNDSHLYREGLPMRHADGLRF